MRILTFTTLFPNALQPNDAVFVQHRMAAVNKFRDAQVRVVAPVPWFPNVPMGSKRWRAFSRIPEFENRADLPVYHPRYIVTPKVGMTLYGFSMFLGVLPTIKRIYKEWPFDVIDAHFVYPDGMAAVLLGRLFHCPVVISARGTDINLYPNLKLVRPLIKQVISGSTGVISVCQSLADVVIELGAEKERVRVIPNGIDPKLFFPIDKKVARRQLGLNENARIVLTVGALIKRKGVHLLLDSLTILREQGLLDFDVYVVGKGEERAALEQQVAEQELNGRVFLVGEVANTDLAAWYNAADLSFLGSSREGWPNVVSESLACGTPVVATSVNGIPEIISSSVLGIVVERSTHAFASALHDGIQREWDHDRIQRHGQVRTWEIVASEVIDALVAVV